ncbi:restriction endonuclease subunit S [Serratia marcescens]|uniref:restriction endonuclease subunit S n=1 Tax=Serratia marcescens TaxID=615 RepID=UPI003B88C953
MSFEWPLKKISEIADFLNSKRIPLKSLDRQKRQGPYPYYGASGIVDRIDGYIFDGTYLLISEDGENLRTRKTPIAFKAHGKFWVNNHAHILSEKEEGVLDYLEYYFSTLDLDPYITGAVQPKLNKANLDSIEIPFPDKDTRLFINATLNSLTQKVAINHKLNQTLEQMAQALFKSWFVDFEPVKAKIAVLEVGGSQEDATLAAMTVISGKDADALAVFEREHPEQYTELKATAELFPSAIQDSELGEIPVGWNVLPLESATSLIIDHRGKTPKKLGGDWSEDGYPAISAKNIKNGRLVRHDAIKYVDPELYTKWMRDVLLSGDILMTSEAPLGELLYLANSSNYLLSQRLYGIRADNNIVSGCYLYLWLQSASAKADINGRATGSTVVGIRQSELKKVNVMAPQKALIESFSSLAAYYLAKIESNEKENIALENLRDTILPKLLSGKITLPEAEQAISEVENV